MRSSTPSRNKSPAHLLRAFLLTLLFPGGRRGIAGGIARTILYLLIAMVLVFLLLWGVLDATSHG